MRVKLVGFLLFFVSATVVFSQTGDIAVREGVPQGDIFGSPSNMQLVAKGLHAHPGEVWVRSTSEGLHVWGKVQLNGDTLYWPIEKSAIPDSDHVEIWLSTAPSVDMPPIGYGNKFDQVTLKSAADCAYKPDVQRDRLNECQRWFKNQVQYRKLFERLFTRHWVGAMAPVGMTSMYEDYATSAWDEMVRSFYPEELPKPLAPHKTDGVAMEFAEVVKSGAKVNSRGEEVDATTITAYTFHFFLPWSDFPATQELSLRDLWLTVEVFGTAQLGRKTGAISTTAPQRITGKTSSLNHLVLEVPREHQITPCRAVGAEVDPYGNSHRIWYIPMAGKKPLYLSTVYDLENPAAPFMYIPTGVSPELRATEHFWKEMPNGGTVCGPQLTILKNDVAYDSTFKIAPERLETKVLPDGWALVRTGPNTSSNPLGSGQCGSCPVTDLHVYAVSPEGKITPALDLKYSWGSGKQANGDFTIAPDWSRITAYEPFVTVDERGKKDVWSAKSFCLAEHAYVKCGEEKPATPPNPRNFDLFGNE